MLEINVADEQIDDLVDDALQYFHERYFDGVTQTFLKYKVTQADIDRGQGRGGSNPIGIVTTTADATIVGTATYFLLRRKQQLFTNSTTRYRNFKDFPL